MDNYRHRPTARIVGYIDMGFSCFGLFIMILSIVGCFVITIACFNDDLAAKLEKALPNQPHNGIQVLRSASWILWIMWVTLAISMSLVILQLYAARKLIKSTDINTDPAEAYKLAMFWRNVCILFLVLSCLGLFYSLVSAIIGIIIRCIYLLFVRQYIMELEEAPTAPGKHPDGQKSLGSQRCRSTTSPSFSQRSYANSFRKRSYLSAQPVRYQSDISATRRSAVVAISK